MFAYFEPNTTASNQDPLIFNSNSMRPLFQNSTFLFAAETDKARKHGMEEFIAADPIGFDHHKLFTHLQKLSLEWRLNDPFASLVSS